MLDLSDILNMLCHIESLHKRVSLQGEELLEENRALDVSRRENETLRAEIQRSEELLRSRSGCSPIFQQHGNHVGPVGNLQFSSVRLFPDNVRLPAYAQNPERVMALRQVVSHMYREKDNCVLTLRKIQRLGFHSVSILRQHFSKYGIIKKVMVVHSRSKGVYDIHKGAVRAANMGFVVFESSDGASRALRVAQANGGIDTVMNVQSSIKGEGIIGNVQISVLKFVKNASKMDFSDSFMAAVPTSSSVSSSSLGLSPICANNAPSPWASSPMEPYRPSSPSGDVTELVRLLEFALGPKMLPAH